jgi:hypothetical protein
MGVHTLRIDGPVLEEEIPPAHFEWNDHICGCHHGEKTLTLSQSLSLRCSVGFRTDVWNLYATAEPFFPIRVFSLSGDAMTIVGACRDALRVLRAKRGAQPVALEPALDEIVVLTDKLDDIWEISTGSQNQGWSSPSEPTGSSGHSPLLEHRFGRVECFVVTVFC